MHTKSVLSIVLYLVMLPLFAQKGIQFFDGNKSYEGVSFTFSTQIPDKFSLSSKTLDVGIVKTPRGGYLVLTMITDDFFAEYIRGPVLIFLENGQVIKCKDRNNHTVIDNESLSYFYLTPGEMNLLKNHDIISVTFYLDNSDYFRSFDRRHRAKNSENIYTSLWIKTFLK